MNYADSLKPSLIFIVVPITNILWTLQLWKKYKISTLWRNLFSGFPAAAAYAAAYAGRGYSSYPGLLAGYPTGRNWDAPSCMNHPFTWCWYIEMMMTIRLNCWWCHCCMPHTSIIEPALAGLHMQNMQNMQNMQDMQNMQNMQDMPSYICIITPALAGLYQHHGLKPNILYYAIWDK